MKFLLALAVVLLAVSVAVADTFDDAEANRRGVPIQQVQLEKAQARIAELEKQLAELKAKDQPAVLCQGTAALVAKINSMPKNLMPAAAGDNATDALRLAQRRKWWEENVKFAAPLTFEGKLRAVRPTTVANAPRTVRGITTVGGNHDALFAEIVCEKTNVLGSTHQIIVRCAINNVKPEDALEWKAGMKISITGTFDGAEMPTMFVGEDRELLVDVSEAKKK